MPLFNRGVAPLGVVLDGQRALRVILDGVVVWDGTRPAFAQAVRFRSTVEFPAPLVRAEAVPGAAPKLSVISVGMIAPVGVVGSSAVQPPRMQTSVSLPSPGLITNALVEVTPAEVGVVMMPAEASENFDGVIYTPPMTVSAELAAPLVTTGFFVAAVKMSVSADLGTPVVTVSSTGVVPAVLVLASVSMPAPAVVTGVNVAAVKQMVNALMPVPTIFAQRNVNITAPAMSVSVAMRAPVVQAALVPSGRQQSVDYQGNPAGVWYEIPDANWASSWATYPSTVKSGNGVQIVGGGLARIVITTHTNSSTSARLARYKINGVANSEDTTLLSANPCVQTFDNVLLASGDIVVPEFRNNGSITSQRTFNACSIEITPMP